MKANLIVIIFVSFSFISYTGNTQSFCNLDFEYGVYKSQPRKWAIEGEGEMYNARLDSSIAKSGRKSLYVQVKNGVVYIFLSMPGKLVAGKTVQIEGYIKFKNTDSLLSLLAFRDPNASKANSSQPIKGNSNEWIFISHQASFPKNYSSDRLLVALIGSGTGDFWFDNVSVKIGGQKYGIGAPDFREPTKREIANLNKTAFPIKSFLADADFTDLVPLKKIIGNASIVALGENSHGSSTIYKLKLRMVKYLITKMGFSIFALEAPTVEADRINDYVLYNKGTLNDVIGNLTYPAWQTKEMIDIIEWIRSYNQTGNNKIEFKGFDMQNGSSAFTAVEGFAKANDKILLASLAELKGWYDDAMNKKQQWTKVREKAEEIYQYLLSENSTTYPGIEVQTLPRMTHYMKVFIQSLSSQYQSEETKSRDEYMAQNIDWLVKNSGGRKIIVSADNTHVTKESGKMGSFLNQWYDKKYIVFGFTYNTGTYSANGPEKYYEVHPPYAGTYEYLFSKSRYKNFLLDLRTTNNIPILNSAAGFRSIGSRPQETTQFTEITLKKHFDAIAYTDSSIATIPLFK